MASPTFSCCANLPFGGPAYGVKADPESAATRAPTGPGPLSGPPAQKAAMADVKWRDGTELVVGFLNGGAALRDKVRQYAPEWSQYCSIRFRFVEGGGPDRH